MVEICPNCGSLNVLKERTVLTRMLKTVYYRCDGCGHEWRELVRL